jgi:serine phosphatase RsbU (regulator of sigma subunit)
VQWSPVVLTFVIGALAVATPRQFAISRLLAAPPALAASMWSVAATVVLGVFTVAALVAIQLVYHMPATTFAAAGLAAVTAAAGYAAHVRLTRERTLSQVRSVAEAAQAVVLRPVPHRLGPVGIETLYLAAAEEARIGGDFYEAVETPHGVRVLIGDVRGKGLSAVGVASAVTNCFREAAYDEPDLTILARRLDTSMGRYTSTMADALPDAGEGFATAVLTQVRLGTGLLEVVNCGHPPPLLMRRDEVAAVEPAAASPPLNMAGLVGGAYTMDAVPFGPGDRLLLYTDGVTETRNAAGVFFPLDEWVGRQGGVSDRKLLELLHERLLDHSGGALDDDIAALVLHFEAPAADAAAQATGAARA